MSAPNVISPDKLNRFIGTPAAPVIIDVRTEEDFDADPYLLPASPRRSHENGADWAANFAGRAVVAVCHHGAKLSHGAAAWLRHQGADAMSLEDGFEGWKAAKFPLVPAAKLPPHDALGRTHWHRPRSAQPVCA